MATTTTNYVPGVCNINKSEIAYRKKAGYVGIGLAIVVLIVLLLLDSPRWTRLGLIAPLLIGTLGFLQAKNRFCVSYGAAGKQNAAPGSKSADLVADSTALAKDKTRASQINRQAFIISVIIMVALLLIP